MKKTSNRYRHGHSCSDGSSPTYSSWRSMRDRCLRPVCKDFKNYGGRGIKVCKRWNVFDNFLADMGERPEGHSIERIDVHGNYCPKNCKWASNEEQRNNTQRSVFLEFNGQRMTLTQWSRFLNLNHESVKTRYRRGWPVAQVLGFEPRVK